MSIINGYIKDSQHYTQYPSELLIQSGFWIIRYKDNHGHTQQLAWDEQKIISKKDISSYTEYHLRDNNQFYFRSDDQYLVKRMHPKTSIHRWLNHNPAFPVVMGISGLLVIGLISFWFALPSINDKISNAIPIETEKKLGDQMIKAILEKEEVLDSISIKVNEYYQALDKKSKYDIRISVIKSDILNAFAVPGGNIVIYKGMLDKMKSHEALAALLGHESTHIEHRHSLRSLTRSLAFSAVIGIIFGGHDLASVLASNASKFSGLKYSRSLEEDADQGSIELMKEKKISLQGMIDLMTTLNEADSSGLDLEFMQIHPLTERRLEVARTAMMEQKNAEKSEKLEAAWEKISEHLK